MTSTGYRRVVQILFALVLVACGVGGTLTYQHFTADTSAPKASPRVVAEREAQMNWGDTWKRDAFGELTGGPKRIKPVAISQDDSDETRYRKETFNNEVVGNPAYDCYDQRNAGLTWHDMAKLRPCVNGSIYAVLHKGDLEIVNSTTSTMTHFAVVGEESDNASYDDAAWDLKVRKDTVETKIETAEGNTEQASTKTKKETFYLLGYDDHGSYDSFENYFRVNGGAWQKAINLNDRSFGHNDRVDVVFTWNDPNKPMNDARVPFDWTQIQQQEYAPQP